MLSFVLTYLTNVYANPGIALKSTSFITNDSLYTSINIVNTLENDTLLIPITNWYIPSYIIFFNMSYSHESKGGYNLIEIRYNGKNEKIYEPISPYCTLDNCFLQFIRISPKDTFKIIYNDRIPEHYTSKSVSRYKTKLKNPYLWIKINYVFLSQIRKSELVLDYLKKHQELISNKKSFSIDDSTIKNKYIRHYLNYVLDNSQYEIDDNLQDTLCKYLQNYKNVSIPIKMIKRKRK